MAGVGFVRFVLRLRLAFFAVIAAIGVFWGRGASASLVGASLDWRGNRVCHVI